MKHPTSQAADVMDLLYTPCAGKINSFLGPRRLPRLFMPSSSGISLGRESRDFLL